MVFTGIVEEKGEVVSMELKPNQKMWDGTISDGWVLKVGDMKLGLQDVKMGCSIAISGVCLTVTVTDWNINEQWATFGISPETRKLTNLRDCKPGDKVNVERAAKLEDRNSGHYVQGHVNGTCTIKEKYEDGDSLRIRFEVLDAKILRGITHKGYIALDGTSLTVTEVDYGAKFFAVMLVPHTRSIICFPSKPVGAHVNVELDIRSALSS